MGFADTLSRMNFDEFERMDIDDTHYFAFMDIREINLLADEGMIDPYTRPRHWIRFVNDAIEWLRYNLASLVSFGRMFVVVFQEKELEAAGAFRPMEVPEKVDGSDPRIKTMDGFDELRISEVAMVRPVAYMPLIAHKRELRRLDSIGNDELDQFYGDQS